MGLGSGLGLGLGLAEITAHRVALSLAEDVACAAQHLV